MYRPLLELLEPRLAPATVVDIYQAAGPSPVAIQTEIQRFRDDLGSENPLDPGSLGNGYRVVNWDTIPDNKAAPNTFAGDLFNANTPGFAAGLLLDTPGTGFQVSASPTNPTGTAPEFGNINATYPVAFQPFSSPRLFTAIASNIVDVRFVIPGTETPATVSAFGAVFADVDTDTSSRLEFFDAGGTRIQEQRVMPAAGNEGLSFAGVRFNSNAIARVRIVTGTAALGPADLTQGGQHDIVALDDFIFSEPVSSTITVPTEPQTVARNRELVFSAETDNSITIQGGTTSSELRLTANNGRIRVPETDGPQIFGNETSSVLIVGPPSQINAALDGMVYRPNGNFVGNDALVVSAEGGLNKATVAISVEAVRINQNEVEVFAAGMGLDGGRVRMFDTTGSSLLGFDAFEPGFNDGVRVASAKFTNDDVPDIVVGNGPGTPTRFRVFDGSSGTQLTEQNVYEPSFLGGIFLTALDLNGDGIADIVTSPDLGGGARIRIYDGATFQVLADFFGIEDPDFRGGARVGSGDINGDGVPDLLVSAGFGGGPRVAIFDGKSLLATPAGETPPKLVPDFFVFEQTLRNGVFITAGDVTGDGADDIIVGAGPGGGPRVFGLDGRLLVASGGSSRVQVLNFFGGNPEARQGVRVTAKDLDGDGRSDVIVGGAAGPITEVTIYRGATITPDGLPPDPMVIRPFGEDFRAGVFVG